jgi:hypothetical protein
MSSEHSPNGWPSSEDDDSLEVFPATEPKGELTPPPRKPPTAVSADASEPQPRPPRPSRRWNFPPRRSDLPVGVAQAIDAALDILDSIGDSVRSTAARLAR